MIYKNKYGKQLEKKKKRNISLPQNIKKGCWINFFKALYDPQQTRACSIPDNIKANIEVTNEEVLRVIETLKNRKSPGMNDITNEMIKHDNEKLYAKIIKLL